MGPRCPSHQSRLPYIAPCLQQSLPMKSLLLCTILLVSCLSQDYDVEISKKLQGYGVTTHCSQQALEKWNCPLCKELQAPIGFRYISNNLSHIVCFAAYIKSLDRIIVIFRGTEDAINWAQDFTYKQVSYSKCANCLIHQGFYLSYLSIAPYLENALDQLMKEHPDTPMIIGGTSLGGTLAMTAAIELQLKYNTVEQLHAAGCPRLGNINLAKFISLRIPRLYRPVHYRDIVPHVPLLTQNFHHPPRQILFDQNMQQYVICDNTGEDVNCSNKYFPELDPRDHVTYWYPLNVTRICGNQ